jgi:SHS family lactate transporter-like MFS transporter
MAGGTTSETAVGGMVSKLSAAQARDKVRLRRLHRERGRARHHPAPPRRDRPGDLLRPERAPARGEEELARLLPEAVGTITINACAVPVLREQGGSLLAVGVTGLLGRLRRGRRGRHRRARRRRHRPRQVLLRLRRDPRARRQEGRRGPGAPPRAEADRGRPPQRPRPPLSAVRQLRGLTGPQWRAFIAAYLGWMLDAFDYLPARPHGRGTSPPTSTRAQAVSYAIGLTLAMRPVGRARLRAHRRPLRAQAGAHGEHPPLRRRGAPHGLRPLARRPPRDARVFGIGMGGEWGVGASLAMESVPGGAAGLLSGILQQGYPAGYLLAALAPGTSFPALRLARDVHPRVPARAPRPLHHAGASEESPAWVEERASRTKAAGAPGRCGPPCARAGRSSSTWCPHGRVQLLQPRDPGPLPERLPRRSSAACRGDRHHLNMIGLPRGDHGGILFGALSQRFGRRRTIAAAALLSLPMIPSGSGPPRSPASPSASS